MTILVAPQPVMHIKAHDRIFVSDYRQVIYDVPEEYVGALMSDGCSPVPPVIVFHAFPEPLSLHCFACGAFIESGEEDPWYWRTKGDIPAFLHDHFFHAKANYVDGWPQYPVSAREHAIGTLPIATKASPSDSFFYAGVQEKPRYRVKVISRRL